eukprot:scaffold373079_cov21-Prasinocladus_malaysianus.AAC.1
MHGYWDCDWGLWNSAGKSLSAYNEMPEFNAIPKQPRRDMQGWLAGGAKRRRGSDQPMLGGPHDRVLNHFLNVLGLQSNCVITH